MQIDWFTFVAQVINFGILLWLLNRFLYVPITDAINERESTIANRIAAADARFIKAKRVEEELRHRREQIDSETESLRATARESVARERSELLDAARQSIEQQRATWIQELEREAQLVNQSLQSDAGEVALEISRRALKDLAGEDLNDRLVDKFIDQLSEIDQPTIDSMNRSIRSGSTVVVTTAGELGATQRKAFESALTAALDGDGSVSYQQDAQLIAGIVLTVGSHEVAFSVRDYLEAISGRFSREVLVAR